MINGHRVSAIIPARNEYLNIEHVVVGLSQLRNTADETLIDEIVVCDNGSTDKTAALAQASGARVVHEPRPGYGAACLSAIAATKASDIFLFVDGDDSVNYAEVSDLLNAVEQGADLVIGARDPNLREPGAMTLPQQVGNSIAARLIMLLWHEQITDLGPFRAIRASSYRRLSMQDAAYGWTVEMQVKAIQLGLSIQEVAVSCRRRRGVSKISGSAAGVVHAALGIFGKIATLWLQEKHLKLITRNETPG